MGSGASRGPAVGVPVNPRVEYADVKSRKTAKHELIDAPVLVKVDQGSGTIRYRYLEREQDPEDKRKRVELAHEGPERAKKHGYFFHAKLNDFSEQADYKKEEDSKFRYVYKGPQRAKQKKVYYVYGVGWDSQNKMIRRRLDPQDGLNVLRIPNHVYYQLTFLPQDGELPEGNDEAEDMANEEETDITKNMELRVSAGDRVQKLRQRMSVRLLKPIGQIHIFLHEQELRPEDVIGDLRRSTEGQWKRFAVLLRPF